MQNSWKLFFVYIAKCLGYFTVVFIFSFLLFFVIDFTQAQKLHRKRNSTTTLTYSVTVGDVLSRQRSQIIRVTILLVLLLTIK